MMQKTSECDKIMLYSVDVVNTINSIWELTWIIWHSLWANYHLPESWKRFGKHSNSYSQVGNWEDSHLHEFPNSMYGLHDIGWTQIMCKLNHFPVLCILWALTKTTMETSMHAYATTVEFSTSHLVHYSCHLFVLFAVVPRSSIL